MSRPRRRRIGGIYCLTCRFTGERYVGRSVDVERRVKRHFYLLNRGEHRNRLMQRRFDHYGGDEFEWKLLQEVTCSDAFDLRSRLKRAEKARMAELQPFFNGIVYNDEIGRMEFPPETWDR